MTWAGRGEVAAAKDGWANDVVLGSFKFKGIPLQGVMARKQGRTKYGSAQGAGAAPIRKGLCQAHPTLAPPWPHRRMCRSCSASGPAASLQRSFALSQTACGASRPPPPTATRRCCSWLRPQRRQWKVPTQVDRRAGTRWLGRIAWMAVWCLPCVRFDCLFRAAHDFRPSSLPPCCPLLLLYRQSTGMYCSVRSGSCCWPAPSRQRRRLPSWWISASWQKAVGGGTAVH